jgi:hypothetical protein
MNNSTIGNCLIGVNLFSELLSIEEVLQQLLNLGRPKIVKTTQILKSQNLFLSISLSFHTNPTTKQLKSYNSQEEEGKVTGQR